MLIFYHRPWFSSDETLIFYHIPKTGGTTITFLLDQQFGPENICRDNFYYENEKRSVDDLDRFSFIRGHFFVNSNLKKIAKAKRITILRDPIDRIISEQRFFKTRYESHWLSHLFSIEHFLPEGEPIDTISNHQCLFLSSFDRDDPMITAQMHLDSAKQNLANNFFFVGITERLDESVYALYKLMGWQPPEIIPKLNVTEKTEDVSLEIREELIQRNWADIELYEFAKTLFEAKLAELRKDHGDSL